MNETHPQDLQPDLQPKESLPDVYPLTANADGIPVLEEVVENEEFDALAEDLKAHLLLELEPLLQDIARRAFTDSVRLVALDLKHAFEREFSTQLDINLRTLVEQSVRQACERAQI
jgi:hypothetical protein